MKTRLTDQEQDLLNEILTLRDDIKFKTQLMNRKLDRLIEPTTNLETFDSKDLDFWIGVLPDCEHRTELKVLKDLLNVKKKR